MQDAMVNGIINTNIHFYAKKSNNVCMGIEAAFKFYVRGRIWKYN